MLEVTSFKSYELCGTYYFVSRFILYDIDMLMGGQSLIVAPEHKFDPHRNVQTNASSTMEDNVLHTWRHL
jgi:hypothetical protein